MKEIKISLKALLYAKLKAKKILSIKEVWEIAKECSAKQSTAERRMRSEGLSNDIPCIPLNSKKKPLEHKNQPIGYWMWAGSKK